MVVIMGSILMCGFSITAYAYSFPVVSIGGKTITFTTYVAKQTVSFSNTSSYPVYGLCLNPSTVLAYSFNSGCTIHGDNSLGGKFDVSLTNNSGRVYYWTYTPNGKDFSTSLPRTDLSLSQVLDELNGGSNGIGTLMDVGYHVNSYGIENNPAGTNEMISWGRYSSSGVDLDLEKYKVEVMLYDKSTMYRRTYQDIYKQGYSASTFGLNRIANGFAYAMDLTTWLSSVFQKSDDSRALADGRLVKASSYGKSISCGYYSARNRRASFNAISKYSTYASSIGNDDNFKNYLDTVISSSSRYDFYNNEAVFYNSREPDYFSYGICYDIMARIVDGSTGEKGNWISINKHNTPYIMSDSETRLNGGYTVSSGHVITNNYNPVTNVWNDTPDIIPDDPDPNDPTPSNPTMPRVFTPQPLVTGIYEGDENNNVTNITNLYNNYTYVYDYGDTIINNIDNRDLESVKEGFDFLKSLGVFSGLYMSFFGAFLPPWCSAIVAVCIPLCLGLLVFKAVKGVIPFV